MLLLLFAVVFVCSAASTTGSAASAVPLSSATPFLGDLTPEWTKASKRDTVEGASSLADRVLPLDFGLPVAIGDKLYLNFSRGDGEQRLMEVCARIRDLPCPQWAPRPMGSCNLIHAHTENSD